ncbi:DNA repair protein rhp7 [Escovopsis weberi]|uniref:DNA repair protein rhp7 n=1 Tax=Escovopsis weberi TaxID=150374 RepID=A0A0M9VRU7_ESCWE|nr:DNA repair protein rhp7 [Escovopsis weberi]
MGDLGEISRAHFLASHNISANQIRLDAEDRRRRADAEALRNGAATTAGPSSASASVTVEASSSRSRRGNAASSQAGGRSKAAKKTTKKRKKQDDSDSEFGDSDLGGLFDKKPLGPLPGQSENCAICRKRFTVTPYSLSGPDGGLLCASCGRELAKEQEGKPKKKQPRKQTGGVGSRRAMQSRILDGDMGTKSLATLCVQTLAKNVHMAETLGDLPEHLIDKIARIFSKRRLLKPDTLPLFAQPMTEMLHIYDGAKLGEQDFINIFQVSPRLKRLKVRCAIQFKDRVMDYLLSRNIALESLSLHGANLLSESKWHEFLAAKGRTLKELQVYYTDNHFGDDTLALLKDHCPTLARLKVGHNQKVTDAGVKAIAGLTTLRHVSFQLQHSPSPDAISTFVSQIGRDLQTLSLKIVPRADDGVLDTIHNHCRALTKLRITDSEAMTDRGFARLFTAWANPPLSFIDLQKCRHLESSRPRLNEDGIGLCGEGFRALMAHSGHRLHSLNVHACRHIPREAFEDVFCEGAEYPLLRKLEISFCEEVTDYVLGCIFRACPSIKEVNVFGCMKVKDVLVPRGVILVGVPNAQGMITEGTH